jgi:hypothetical protein
MKKTFTIFTKLFVALVSRQFPKCELTNSNKIFVLKTFSANKIFEKNQHSSFKNFKKKLTTSFSYSTVFKWMQDVAGSILNTKNSCKWFVATSSNRKPP